MIKPILAFSICVILVFVMLSFFGCANHDSSYRAKDLLWAEEIWWATYHGGSKLEYGPSLSDAVRYLGAEDMDFVRRSDLYNAWVALGMTSDFQPEYNPPWQWCFDWTEGKTDEGYK